MQHRLILILIAITFAGVSTSFAPEEITTCQDCSQEYLKMMNYYSKVDMQKVHMVYTSYSIMNSEIGKSLTTEIVQNKGKLRWHNELGAMYQDEQTSVIVAFDRKQIVLQKSNLKSSGNQVSWNKIAGSYQIDSLKKYFKPIQCSANKSVGYLNVEMKDSYHNQSEIRTMKYDYELRTGKMLKVEIGIESNGSIKKEITEVKKFASGNIEEPFSGSALSQVMNGNKLKELYKNYTLTDVR